MTDASNDDRRARLDGARKELLKRRLQGGGPDTGTVAAAASTITARADPALAPASYSQARLYFLDQLHGAGAAYHMVLGLRLGGALDRDALQRALDALVQRHASLRTTFEMRDGALMQCVAREVAVPLEEEYLEGADDTALQERLRQEVQAPFSLAQGPLLRARLLSLGDDEHVLVLVLHHIIADEWSLGLLRRELATCYGGGGESLAPLTVDYGDFALWQREQVATQRDTQLAYWKRKLAHIESSLGALPADHRRPAQASLRGGWLQRELEGELASAVVALARRHQATPYMVLLALFLTLMHRLSGQEDVRVGTPVAARTPTETEGLVGLFLNSVVIREQLSASEPFEQLLARVRATALAAVEHQTLPFEVLVAELQAERDPGANPLFQTMFVLEGNEGGDADFGSLSAQRIPVASGYAKLDLTFFARLDEVNGLTVSVEYAEDLYEPSTPAMVLETYEQLLRSAVASPRTPVGELTVLAPGQAAELRKRACGPALASGADSSIVPSILRRAQERGEEAMLIDGRQRLSGHELHDDVHRIAAALARRGVGPGAKVIVALARGADQIVAVLGVLAAGAAYVPLDPDYPSERRRQVIEDLTVEGRRPLLLSDGSLAVDGAEPLALASALEEAPLSVAAEASAGDPAYVIYTSGSTGRAKGVVITHGNLLASTLARTAYYEQSPQRYLLVSSYAFDSSVAGIFWTLMAGDSLVLADAEQAADPRALARLIDGERITHTLMLPGLYALLLEAAAAAQLASLRTVIVAGEACPVAVPAQHARKLPDTRLTNEYGPTEGTVWATAYDCTGTERDRVPIGRPIAGAQTYVLDGRGELLPDGAVGELWIGGAGVAAGYLGQGELTDQRFRTLPALGAGRCYRTGDLVRRACDGELTYIGRADEQIKLRGFRIEPAEIEGLLRSHGQVQDAAVSVLGDRLVAWLVADGEVPAPGDLRAYLSQRVPAYMVPTRFHTVDALGRLPNGKIDRNSLTEPAGIAPAALPAQADFADEIERDLAALWGQLLGVDEPTVQDDFFELGGHSLAGVSLMLEIERRFGLALPLAALFQAPRLADLAQRIREGRTRTRAPLLIPVQPKGSRTPLICVHGGARQAARYLGDEQPVYLAFTHLADRDSEGNSVQTMAERYLTEVRDVQPRGPYRICGFSFGGKIAYEMACRLRAQGESVTLALCDPPPPAGADYYRQQWRARREELKRQGLGGGLRMAAQILSGRLRTWRMRFLDAYFSRSPRSARVLYGASATLMVLGLAIWLGAGWVLNQPIWRPLVLDLSPAQQFSGSFVAAQDGRIELALEVDRALSTAQLRRSALAVKRPAPLDMRWEVADEDGAILARGDVRDYAYIDPGPRTLVGRLRRILTRVPFGQSDRYYSSFGLLGLPSAERGVGAFEVQAGQRYRLSVTTQADLASIEELSPRFVARLDRARFAQRYERTMPYSIGGLLTVVVGLALALLTFIRQRQSTPASLISYRDRQHYRRMSARYRYPPYDGELTLLLPQTYAVYRDETRQAWSAMVHGDVHLELITGARRHVDLINETAGQLLAAGLARWLRRAEKGKHEPNE